MIRLIIIFVLLFLTGSQYYTIVKLENDIKTLNLNLQKLNERVKQIEYIEGEFDSLYINFQSEISQADMLKNYEYEAKNIKKNQEKILSSILKYSEEYDISPIVLYSIIKTESEFLHHIEHPPVKLKSGKTIRAVGLGGVIWEFWGSKLKKEGIANSRNDLFNIEVNIEASAFIFNEFLKLKQLKNTSNKLESALARYYGSSKAGYQNKIAKQMSKILGFEYSFNI